VDLKLLESAPAAASATRNGLRRLFMMELGLSPARLDAQLPAALDKQLRRELAGRALDSTFELSADPASLPRDKAAFAARLAAGRAHFADTLAQLGTLGSDLTTELGKVQAALRPLTGKPGVAKAVVDDVQSQLRHLAPIELVRTASLARLGHVLRYLRALQVRLQRQAHDPLKDQQKATQVVPLWQAFVARYDELRTKGRTPAELDEHGWLLEELRVHVFAPELKTPVAVSPARVQDLWNALVR
jgi:ATP-dependent helicase HrpA